MRPTLLFAGCIFAAAFLLFQVQPMVGKRILPWFGGVPGVWSLCLAFYQFTLFCGYGYGHLLTRYVAGDRQPFVHAAVLVAAIASLPVLPGRAWQPDGAAEPSAHILLMLAANVGMPFLFLASSGPLLQAWYARSRPGRSPYVLYAVSNAGSLLALLTFPFLIEPLLSLGKTSALWSACFVAFGALIVFTAWTARQGGVAAPLKPQRASGDPPSREAGPGEGRESVERVVLWILLPAVAVVLLMGVTNELCLDVASFPFLWVAPLAIYLITFIVAFASEAPSSRRATSVLAALALFWLYATTDGTVGLVAEAVGPGDIAVLIVTYSLVLLLHCLMLHGELHRLRPEPASLTLYYLCIAFGGAAGGVFVGIAAPLLFVDYYEVPLGIVACWVLCAAAWLRGRPPTRRRALVGVAVGLGLVLSVSLLRVDPNEADRVSHQGRNFFGVLRVLEIEPDDPRAHTRMLHSGTTVHGLQFVNPRLHREPTLYYGRNTGIGFVMRALPARPVRVGVIGLGVGTLAAYGRAGDHFRFYEIDPEVVRIARDPARFDYLARSAARVTIRVGDGRLSLASEFGRASEASDSGERRGERFDVLVLDAFSSDSIPVHLLTAEAFQVYDAALVPDGVLALHVSSGNLSLSPLVLRLGETLGMRGVEILNTARPRAIQAQARWVILMRDAERQAAVESAIRSHWRSQSGAPKDPALSWPELEDESTLWTDDYSDVLELLRESPPGAGAGAG